MPFPARPRNQRLPREAYCDPARFTFVTLRATLATSPFATVREDDIVPVIEFNHALCGMIMTCLLETRDKYGCDIAIACLMPDHMHLLIRPRAKESDVLIAVDRFKGRSTNLSWDCGVTGRLWQPRSYDHVLWPEESPEAFAEYISQNPVRKRYVREWREWPYTKLWDPFE